MDLAAQMEDVCKVTGPIYGPEKITLNHILIPEIGGFKFHEDGYNLVVQVRNENGKPFTPCERIEFIAQDVTSSLVVHYNQRRFMDWGDIVRDDRVIAQREGLEKFLEDVGASWGVHYYHSQKCGCNELQPEEEEIRKAFQIFQQCREGLNNSPAVPEIFYHLFRALDSAEGLGYLLYDRFKGTKLSEYVKLTAPQAFRFLSTVHWEDGQRN